MLAAHNKYVKTIYALHTMHASLHATLPVMKLAPCSCEVLGGQKA